MSIDDNENYYVLKDDEHEEDNSPLNYAAYSRDDIKDQEQRATLNDIEAEDSEETEIKRKSAFGILFKIMFNPVEGWKTLRRTKTSLEGLQSACFYPLLAILALSKFAEFYYSVEVSLTKVVTEAIVAFVAFFLGYFCIPVILTWVLPKEAAEKIESKFGKEYVLVALTTLVLFSILTDLLPMLWPILIFLPIWTLYIMFKGVRFFLLPQQVEVKFVLWSGLCVIAVPILIDYFLNLIMPY